MPVAISDSPAFAGAWHAILQEANIPYRMLDAPHGRKRRMFTEGRVLLDCCAIPEWHNTKAENRVQLFSDSFFRTEERYVFPVDMIIPIDTPEQLKSLRVATVRGFHYEKAAFFGEKVVGRHVADILKLVDTGRAHVGIISATDFRMHMKKHPRNLALGGLYSSADLRIRVHKSRADLLPRINEAIARLKEGRQMKAIIEATYQNPSSFAETDTAKQN